MQFIPKYIPITDMVDIAIQFGGSMEGQLFGSEI